jgi:5-carboxymethyl-2-hydroxymuconate isomerase
VTGPDDGAVGDLQACREQLAVQVTAKRAAEDQLEVALDACRVLTEQVAALMDGRDLDGARVVRELSDRCAVMRVGLLRLADEIDGHGTVSAARVRKLAGA